MTQKELKDQYRIELAKAWGDDTSMIDYVVKKTSNILSVNGKIFPFTKPTIKKSMCFGWGYGAGCTYEEAQAAQSTARNSQQYFLDMNLAELDQDIKSLEEASKNNEHEEFFCIKQYRNKQGNIWVMQRKTSWNQHEWRNGSADPVTATMLKAYLLTLKEERSRFERRLRTYLKRYGMDKIKSHTYWTDA